MRSKIRLSHDDKLLNKYREDYKVGHTKYKDGIRTELWRKNPKGFYNFVCYLNDSDQAIIDRAILNDLKEQRAKK